MRSTRIVLLSFLFFSAFVVGILHSADEAEACARKTIVGRDMVALDISGCRDELVVVWTKYSALSKKWYSEVRKVSRSRGYNVIHVGYMDWKKMGAIYCLLKDEGCSEFYQLADQEIRTGKYGRIAKAMPGIQQSLARAGRNSGYDLIRTVTSRASGSLRTALGAISGQAGPGKFMQVLENSAAPRPKTTTRTTTPPKSTLSSTTQKSAEGKCGSQPSMTADGLASHEKWLDCAIKNFGGDSSALKELKEQQEAVEEARLEVKDAVEKDRQDHEAAKKCAVFINKSGLYGDVYVKNTCSEPIRVHFSRKDPETSCGPNEGTKEWNPALYFCGVGKLVRGDEPVVMMGRGAYEAAICWADRLYVPYRVTGQKLYYCSGSGPRG